LVFSTLHTNDFNESLRSWGEAANCSILKQRAFIFAQATLASFRVFIWHMMLSGGDHRGCRHSHGRSWNCHRARLRASGLKISSMLVAGFIAAMARAWLFQMAPHGRTNGLNRGRGLARRFRISSRRRRSSRGVESVSANAGISGSPALSKLRLHFVIFWRPS
jgi:hypothetical protein